MDKNNGPQVEAELKEKLRACCDVLEVVVSYFGRRNLGSTAEAICNDSKTAFERGKDLLEKLNQ